MRYLFLVGLLLITFTVFADMPIHRLGCIPEDPTALGWIKSSPVKPQPTKASVDHSPNMPPVGNQANQGSCVAWATAYYYKTYQEWVEHGWDVTDTKYQFSPAFMYNIINRGADNGAYISDGFKLLSDLGCASLYYSPYDDNDATTWPDEADFGYALPYRGSYTYYINVTTDAGIDQLKTILQNGYNAVIGISVWEPFYYNNFGSDYVYDTGDATGTNYGGHAVCIVGFDDSKPTNDGTGAFKIVNSWDTWFGDNGYFWMSYEAVKSSQLCQGYAYYQDDRIGYDPKIKLYIQLDHSKREYLYYYVGTKTNKWAKYYFNWSYSIMGENAFPDHPIILDMTDAFDEIDPYSGNDSLYVRVLDNGSGVGGTVTYVATDNYVWGDYGLSYDTPANVNSGSNVILYIGQVTPSLHWPTFHGFYHRKGVSSLSFQYSYADTLYRLTTITGVPSSPVIGDIDGDGTQEILVTTSAGYLYVLDGSTGAILNSYGPLSTPIYASPTLSDFNKDDSIEIAFESGDSVYILDNHCNELYKIRLINTTHSSPILTNIDGDSDFEIVTSGQRYPVRVLKGSNYGSKWYYNNSSAPVKSSPATADVDGDGIKEVVVTSVNGSIYAVHQVGTGILAQVSWSYGTGDSIYSSPVISDIDNDGTLEVITGSDDGYVYVIHGDGTLFWNANLGGKIRTTPAVADINNDGYEEVIVGTENGLYILDYQGNILASQTGAEVTASPVIFDANGDGSKDIVLGTADSLIQAYKSGGSLLWSVKLDGIPQQSPAIGDINGDGFAEIVIGTDNGTIYALTSSQTGVPEITKPAFVQVDGFGGKIEVRLSGFNSKNFAFTVFDLSGRKVLTTAREVNGGSGNVILKNDLPSGVYFLKVETEGYSGINKFTLLK